MSGRKDGPTETQVISKDPQHVSLHTDGVTKSSKGRYRADQSVTMMAVVNKQCTVEKCALLWLLHKSKRKIEYTETEEEKRREERWQSALNTLMHSDMLNQSFIKLVSRGCSKHKWTQTDGVGHLLLFHAVG